MFLSKLVMAVGEPAVNLPAVYIKLVGLAIAEFGVVPSPWSLDSHMARSKVIQVVETFFEMTWRERSRLWHFTYFEIFTQAAGWGYVTVSSQEGSS